MSAPAKTQPVPDIGKTGACSHPNHDGVYWAIPGGYMAVTRDSPAERDEQPAAVYYPKCGCRFFQYFLSMKPAKSVAMRRIAD